MGLIHDQSIPTSCKVKAKIIDTKNDEVIFEKTYNLPEAFEQLEQDTDFINWRSRFSLHLHYDYREGE